MHWFTNLISIKLSIGSISITFSSVLTFKLKTNQNQTGNKLFLQTQYLNKTIPVESVGWGVRAERAQARLTAKLTPNILYPCLFRGAQVKSVPPETWVASCLLHVSGLVLSSPFRPGVVWRHTYRYRAINCELWARRPWKDRGEDVTGLVVFVSLFTATMA